MFMMASEHLPQGLMARQCTGLTGHVTSREAELLKLLTAERQNYRSLKQLTTRLQDEFIQAQTEIKHLLGDKQALQDQMNLQAVEFQRSLMAKTKQVEEIRQQTMSPLQQELLRAQMQQEMDAPVREMRRQLEEETEKYKAEYYKLRYECMRLQSQSDQQREEHARTLESQRLRYQAEMSCLQKDKEDLVARLQSSDLRSNDKKVASLLKERVQLKVRLQGLETEVTELHAQKVNLSQQAENVAEVMNKQLRESHDLGRSLEMKLESACQQLEKKEKELQESYEENCSLSKQLHGAQRQITSLTCQIENLTFSHKQEVNSIKMEFTLSQGEVEKEKNVFQGQAEVLQTEVELLRAEITQLKAALVEKEEEMCKKVLRVHQDGLNRAAQLQMETFELEERMTQVDVAVMNQIQEWKEFISNAKYREEAMSKHLQNLEMELQQHRSQVVELERYKVQMWDLQQLNNEICEQLRNMSSTEDELRKTNKQLQETLERVREELKTTQVQAEKAQQKAERTQQEAQRLLQDSRNECMEENRKLQQKYSQAKEKMQRAAEAQKKRKTMTEHTEKKLQNKIDLLEAKIEELELEVSLSKKNVSSCEQAYERKMKNLLQAKKDFEHVLFGDCSNKQTFCY